MRSLTVVRVFAAMTMIVIVTLAVAGLAVGVMMRHFRVAYVLVLGRWVRLVVSRDDVRIRKVLVRWCEVSPHCFRHRPCGDNPTSWQGDHAFDAIAQYMPSPPCSLTER